MQYGEARPPQFKVILLGESGVGKTSLFQRFRSKDIPSTPKSALMLDRYQYSREFAVGPESSPVQLDLWDTANMERARSLTESYFRETSATLLVYDMANAISLKRLSYWQQEMSYHMSDSSTGKVFLVGNKSDLEIAKYDTKHTTVSYAKDVIGKQCSNVMDVFEVSAKEGYCVERMFHAVAEHIWQWYAQENRKGSISGGTVAVHEDIIRKDSLRLHEEKTENEPHTNSKGWGCC